MQGPTLQIGTKLRVNTGSFRGTIVRIKSTYTSPDAGQQFVLECIVDNRWLELCRESRASLLACASVIDD